MPEQQAARPFQVGDRVRIRRSSEYYSSQPLDRRNGNGYTPDAIGVVDYNIHGPHVNWVELGYTNGYGDEDLELASAPQSTETPYAKDIVLVLGENEYILAQAIVSRNHTYEDLVSRFCNEYSSLARGRTVMAFTLLEARKIVERLLGQLEEHQRENIGALLDWRDR